MNTPQDHEVDAFRMEFPDYNNTETHSLRDILKAMISEELEFRHRTHNDGLLVLVNPF